MMIGFELNDDLTLIERNTYTLIDVAAEAGGLQAILAGFFSAILSVINYNNFNNYLAERLDSFNIDSSQKTGDKFSRGCCS